MSRKISGADPALAVPAEPVSRLGPSGFDRGEGFTPGPWQRKSDYEPTIIIGNVDGEIYPDGSTSYSYDFIANLEDEYGGSPPNAYANAALILAAPGLYAAADKARILIGAGNDDLPEAVRESRINEAWHLLNNALKQARGEQ